MIVLQEAQGFSRTKRDSRLVYDYKDCSQGTKNDDRSPRKQKALPEVVGTMDKAEMQNNTRGGMSRYGYNGSPKSSIKQSPGSVLSKASMFESRTNFVKVKDPAEMSLSERKALFERNKGEALIPKAPLTMSVPAKKLMEKEKLTAGNFIYQHNTMLSFF